MYKSLSKKQLVALILAGVLFSQTGIGFNAYAAADTSVKTTTSVVEVKPAVVEQLVVGQIYNGFKLVSKTFSSDLNSDVFQFEHATTGGKLVYIANDDKNKWFNVAFRTPTVDHTGINHIIEHTVLEGSEKYNLKSPFTEMGKRSVSTYMNAFTGSDVTSYPIASENDQDFKNLMSVYMDAAFSPLVVKDKKLLMQEGWRYEVDEKTGKISVNGVVFNEMKGALADMYDTIFTKLPSLVYPDTKYKYNSGGDPEYIVDLTHAHLAETHKKYYTPSNACIMLYGKLNIQESLKFINDEYYSKYTKMPEIVDNKVQKTFDKAKSYTFNYPADSTASPETDSVLTYSYALNGTDSKDRLGLSILSIILSSGDNSPMYKNTVEKDLGQDVSVEMDASYYQPMFAFFLEGANAKDMASFEKSIQTTLNDLVKKGIDKERIEAIINAYELSFKSSLLSANKGEAALQLVNGGFITHGDPLMDLNGSESLAKIRKESMDGKYFESLIQKYLIGNKHLVKTTFVPDSKYMANINKNIDKKIDARIKAMSKTELATLKEEAKAYQDWQNKPMDLETLKALPTLKISDLDLTTKKLKTGEKTILDTPVYEHEVNALGLTKLSLYFDLSTLTEKELQYIGLFSSVVANSDTKQYSNEKFGNLISKYTGGISTTDVYLADQKNINKVYPLYSVEAIFAKEHSAKASELITELLTNAKINDKELVKTKLDELVDSLKNQKVNNSSDIVSSRMNASLTKVGALKDVKYNEGYATLVKANDNFEKSYPEIQKNLESIYRKVFNKNNMKWSVASDAEGITLCENAMEKTLSTLKTEKLNSITWNIDAKQQKTAMVIPSEMQYVNMGFNLKRLGYEVTGQDLVFAQILSDGYMYENIRLKGGAYGGYFVINTDGRVRFITYRDPNLKQSVDTIKDVVKYLKNYKPTQAEIDNAIIAVAGKMDQGVDLFAETNGEDENKITAYDVAEVERLKKEMLQTTTADLTKFTEKMEKGLNNSSLIVAGSGTKVEEDKALFETVKMIQE